MQIQDSNLFVMVRFIYRPITLVQAKDGSSTRVNRGKPGPPVIQQLPIIVRLLLSLVIVLYQFS